MASGDYAMINSTKALKTLLADVSPHLEYNENYGMITFRGKELITVFQLEWAGIVDEFWLMNPRTEEKYTLTRKSIQHLLEKTYPDGMLPNTTVTDNPWFYPDGKAGY